MSQRFQNLNVSDVSCKYPVPYGDPGFNDDVNELVTVANTHSCRATCYKYRKTKDQCRFEYPREIVPETVIEGNKINLKRTNQMINNYNPSLMTCLRSNHDIKFIPSGKDGKNIAFYVTNYSTKDQMSTNNMVPFIAISKKLLDEDPSIAASDQNSRAKAMITKCLNKITTETEISGSHVSHFLLGHKDNKTSHNFTSLNLHSALIWLANAIKDYDDIAEESPSTTLDDENEVDDANNSANSTKVSNDDNDDSDDDDDNDDQNTTYTLTTGNNGLVLIDQMTDYINRGQALKHMCLWEYRSRVYKKKSSEEEVKKIKKKAEKKKSSNRKCEEVHEFLPDHPQSKTHLQRVRVEGSTLVPTLSKLPPSSDQNKTRYQKCVLLLFKPFSTFEELYNGIGWAETYSEFIEITENKKYVENLEEFLKCVDESIEDIDGTDEQVRDEVLDECDDDIGQGDETEDAGLDSQTTQALEIIKSTPWLDESISNYQSDGNTHPLFDSNSVSLLPSAETWKADLEKQNQDKKDNPDEEEYETDDDTTITEMATIDQNDDADIDFSTAIINVEQEQERIQRLRDDVISESTLNRKQQKAFEISTENIIKRYLKEDTEQLIGYIGGPGGTGKSQVIKAIIEFHKKMKVRHTLKLCANTGTAAKLIEGSTTTTLFGFSMKNEKDTRKLQEKFAKVETIIIDEVSMIGCHQLVKIHRALCKAKCVPSSVPFGGVDMIFFGDFIQFPPVKDSPLYCGWTDSNSKSKSRQTNNTKILGANLWRQVNKIVLLDQQMRCTDQVYLDILNRLRESKCTDRDAALLNSRVVGQNVDITSIQDAPIIVPGNQLVMAINKQFIASLSNHTKVYVSKAEDYIGRKKNGQSVPKVVSKKIKNWAPTSTRGLPRELHLFIGMPVMVTNNIATELGITNGAVGKIRSIHLKNGETITEGTGYHHLKHQPDFVIVELEDVSMRPLDGLPPNHVPISAKSDGFSVYLKDKKKSIHVNRSHFPLVPRYSCTAHKSQGKTLRKAVVDLVPIHGNTKTVGKEFAYVPLSRVRRLQDLTILRPFDPSILNAPVNEGCAAMMEEFERRDLCKDM